ncbi:hypothetical protein GCM10028832_02290 [Streptomyces sparsus]
MDRSQGGRHGLPGGFGSDRLRLEPLHVGPCLNSPRPVKPVLTAADRAVRVPGTSLVVQCRIQQPGQTA